jgi:hypothetical protein
LIKEVYNMDFQAPGVYVLEQSSGVKPIEGVGTSTGAFIGIAEKGNTHKAEFIANWTQFEEKFGTFIPNGYLAYAVYSFFQEGGKSCYVVRVASDSAASSTKTFKDGSDVDALAVTSLYKGTWGDNVYVDIENPSTGKDAAQYFTISIKYKEKYPEEYIGEEPEGYLVETFKDISITNVEAKVNGVSKFISVDVKNNVRPINIAAGQLAGGVDGLDDPDYIGTEANKHGLHAFDEVDDINIVAIPDKFGDPEVISAGLNYCKNRKDCFFVADPPYSKSPVEIKQFRSGTGGGNTGAPLDSSYGALYYPWIYVSDMLTGKNKLIPPSGAVAGTYAYTDSTRGVHKAPAGTSEGKIDSAVGIERIVTSVEQEILNPDGINVIRKIPAGICIWGARTLSVSDKEWKYINIRRLFLYLEESLDEASQWVVFEPNSPALWGSVIRNITAFLLLVWRNGALFGSSPDEAFFVKVDEENNPPEVRDLGQLIIDVGVAPVKPAEFVIIRIKQKTLAK